jgi:hypothetical protein
MSRQHLLECECGASLRVASRQAGEFVRCSCGKTIPIPALRELEALKLAEPTDAPISPESTWTTRQGLTFVVGVVMLAGASVALIYLVTARLRLDTSASTLERFLERDTLSGVPVEEAFAAWQAYRDLGLGWRPSPEYSRARQRRIEVNVYLALASALAVLGVATTASSFFLKPKGPAALSG